MGTLDVRQTNHRESEEWYTCDRCGFPYPRKRVAQIGGLILCFGENTVGCKDQYGYQYYMSNLDVPYEKPPDPLPYIPWDDIK